MKLLSKKGKWLMVLACTLYAAESVLIAVQVYLQAEILEWREREI